MWGGWEMYLELTMLQHKLLKALAFSVMQQHVLFCDRNPRTVLLIDSSPGLRGYTSFLFCVQAFAVIYTFILFLPSR